MANLFLNIPATAGNGVGAPVDASGMGGKKTITVQESFRGSINIEVLLVDGSGWAQVATFTNTGKKVLNFASKEIRARRTGVPDIDPGLPNIDVSANDDGAMFAGLPYIGTSVDTSALGNEKTVIVQNLSIGGTVNIQVSDDEINWATCMTFKASDVQFRAFTAKFMRALGSAALISVGAINAPGGGQGVDELVKVTANDTTPDYLLEKLEAGSGITLTELNDGGDEGVEIKAEGLDAGNIDTGVPITVRGDTNAEGSSTDLARSDHDHRLEYEVEDEGALVSARPRMDFVGDGVGAVDDAINDKTIVTIPGPNLGDGGAVVKRSTYVGIDASTSSLAYVDGMSGLSVTVPIDGDYWIMFEGEGENQSNGVEVEVAISVNNAGPGGAVIAGSERLSEGNSSDTRPIVTTVQAVGLTAGDIIRAMFRRVGGGGPQTVTMKRRHLSIFKVQ